MELMRVRLASFLFLTFYITVNLKGRMEMKEFKTVTKTVQVLSALTCNKCGVSQAISEDPAENLSTQYEFQSFKFRFGFGSKFDEEKWSFDLCEGCLEEFVNTFKIKHEVKYY